MDSGIIFNIILQIKIKNYVKLKSQLKRSELPFFFLFEAIIWGCYSAKRHQNLGIHLINLNLYDILPKGKHMYCLNVYLFLFLSMERFS